MNASSRSTSSKPALPDWILWMLFSVGFVITIWALQDAEITMIVAHYQWEIHEETALKIALWIWVPIAAATWASLRLLRRRHCSSISED